MAKRKKPKKRSISTGSSASTTKAPVASSSTSENTSAGATSIPSPAKSNQIDVAVAGSRWGYVRNDFRAAVGLAFACIALELALWALLTLTGVGPALYGLITI